MLTALSMDMEMSPDSREEVACFEPFHARTLRLFGTAESEYYRYAGRSVPHQDRPTRIPDQRVGHTNSTHASKMDTLTYRRTDAHCTRARAQTIESRR
eukprot:4955629-Prymnesium_polylepis.1